MTNTNKGYTIEKLTDLLVLDDRQLDDCLACLKEWVKLRRDFPVEITKLNDALQEAGLGEVSAKIEFSEHMVWVDDGVTGISKINVHLSQGQKTKGRDRRHGSGGA